MKESKKGKRLGRREFLRRSALAGLGVGLLPLSGAVPSAGKAEAQVRRYVSLGSTEIKMSDISFGGSRLDAGEEEVVLHALDRGINYFDTAESYSGGDSETTIGNAVSGRRDKVYLTSKVLRSHRGVPWRFGLALKRA